MKYTVGFNWDDELLSQINYPDVVSVYAGEGNAVIGSGRAPLVIQSVEDEQIKRSINSAHKLGIKFEFTLNSGCLSNKEYTKDGHKNIIEYLEKLETLGADSITVTLPSIINIAQKYTPNLKIKISTFQKIASVEMAKRFDNMGVDAIMLAENCNRDFRLLEAIKRAVHCKVILIANVGCIYNCPNSHSHIVTTSHSCDCDRRQTIFTIIPHSAECMLRKLSNPIEMVKSPYIRPEDVRHYENLGIDMLKICDRHTRTDVMTRRVKAYIDQKYEGNLLDLVGQKSERKSDEINQKELQKLLSQGKETANKTMEYFKYFDFSISDLINIDNQKYPSDFIEWFKKMDCTRTNCDNCGYCKKIAERVMSVDKKKVDEVVKGLNTLKNKIYNGSILC